MNYHEWTESELDYLRVNSDSYTYEELGEALRMSPTAVRSKVLSMGLPHRLRSGVIRRNDVWSESNLSYLREKFPMTPIGDIADVLCMPYHAVLSKSKELGLQRDKRWGPRVWANRYVKDYKHNINKVCRV